MRVDQEGTIDVTSIRGVPGGFDLHRWSPKLEPAPAAAGTLPFKYLGQPDDCGVLVMCRDQMRHAREPVHDPRRAGHRRGKCSRRVPVGVRRRVDHGPDGLTSELNGALSAGDIERSQ